MAELITGSVLLYCNRGSSNKEYLIEVYRDTDATDTNQYRGRYGPRGALRGLKEYGSYSRNAVRSLIESKQAKSYEIISVNGKPFTSGSVHDALLVIDQGGWDSVSTNQPPRKIRPVDVVVTFNPGQFAPVW